MSIVNITPAMMEDLSKNPGEWLKNHNIGWRDVLKTNKMFMPMSNQARTLAVRYEKLGYKAVGFGSGREGRMVMLFDKEGTDVGRFVEL